MSVLEKVNADAGRIVRVKLSQRIYKLSIYAIVNIEAIILRISK